MKKHFKYLAVILLISSNFMAFSQDTIVVLSGDKIAVSKLEYNQSSGNFTYLNNKNKAKVVPVDGVFSVIDSKGKEKVYYTADSINESGSFMYTESEMRDYMNGRLMAQKERKPIFSTIASTGFVGGVTFATTFVFTPAIPIVPIAYLAVSNAMPVGEKKIKEKHPEFSTNEAFILGYKDAVESKRKKNAVIGTTAGFVIGIVSKIIYDSITIVD